MNMNMRVLFGVAAATLCGTVGILAADTSSLLRFELRAFYFTLPTDVATKAGLAEPSSSGSSGCVLTPQEFEKLVARLSKEKGFDATAMPHVTSGDEASVVEMIREFRYPVEYEAADFSGAKKIPAGGQMTDVMSPTV